MITHPFDPYINKESRVLILGTFPSVKSRENNFYYSHKRNRFFPILCSIYNEPLPLSIEDKKKLLDKYHIALYDVIYSCDIVNSDDSSIKNVTPIDIVSLLKEHPAITKIGITGKKASKLFNKYLKDKVDIPVIYLPSTSPANARISFDNLVKEYKKIF